MNQAKRLSDVRFSSPDPFSPKVIGISGTGGRGIGSALAKVAASRGHHVVGCDYLHGPCGFEAEFVPADLRDEAAARRVVGAAVQRFGRLDVLITNACVARRDDCDPDNTPASVVLEAYRDNFMTAFNLVAPSLAVMKKQRAGTIVLISSVNGRLGCYGQVGYSCAKPSLESLAHIVTATHARFGVRCLVAMLGTCPNSGPSWERRRREMPSLMAAIAGFTPREQNLNPDEAARNILALASDDLSAVTGCVIPIDGGLLAVGLPLHGGDWRSDLVRLAEFGLPMDPRNSGETEGALMSAPTCDVPGCGKLAEPNRTKCVIH